MRIHYKAHKMAILKGGGSGKFPPVKTNKLTWMQALKKWNEAHSTAMWCVPRMHDPKSGKGWAIRTTAEYDEVRDIMLHGALSKGQILKGEKRVAKGKEAPFVSRSRARAQKGMTEAERKEYEAVMAGVRRARPSPATATAAAARPIASSSSSASKAEPRRVGNRIQL
jgi:hypothetical protein